MELWQVYSKCEQFYVAQKEKEADRAFERGDRQLRDKKEGKRRREEHKLRLKEVQACDRIELESIEVFLTFFRAVKSIKMLKQEHELSK